MDGIARAATAATQGRVHRSMFGQSRLWAGDPAAVEGVAQESAFGSTGKVAS